jgi:hypothetical protein
MLRAIDPLHASIEELGLHSNDREASVGVSLART